MKLHRHIFFLPLILLFCFTVKAQESLSLDSHILDSLNMALEKAKTPADSLVIMDNLYDFLPRDIAGRFGLKMLDVADRAHKPSRSLEITRSLANRFTRDDKVLKQLLYRTESGYYAREKGDMEGREHAIAVNDDELMETLTFLRLARNIHQAQYSAPEKRSALLKEILQTNAGVHPSNIYDRIVMLHSLCTMLMQMGSSDLLPPYMDSLGTLINRLPPSQESLRNAYNNHAALIYFKSGQYEKAKEADIETLSIIDRQEKKYHENGGKLRTFDANRYLIYQRLLSIFPILTPKEIENYYSLAMELVKRDYSSAANFKRFPGPEIFYRLSKKDYATALPLIKDALNSTEPLSVRKELLKYGIESARALGETKALADFSSEYIDYLEKSIDSKLEDKYSELQLLYNTYNIQNNLNQLQIEKQAAETSMIRLILIVSIIAGLILLISVVILIRINNRKRALLEVLDKSNRALRTEREKLENSRAELVKARDAAQKANNLKSDFIKNMSYEVNTPLNAINEYSRLIMDCADASNRKYLERFTELVELNSELLNTIIGDMLNLSEIDNSSITLYNKAVDLHNICNAALDGVRNRLKPGISLQFDTASPRISLFTDPQRLHQILLNLLTNAAKFTEEGSIALAFREENDKIVFTVTDTGIGINPDKKDVIFDRFVKLDRQTQGTGLGLTISRYMARMLGGDLRLDTDYKKGSRFILILPKK